MFWLDILIGLFLVNGAVHIVLGLFGVRFISLLGLSPTANLFYGGLNLVGCLVIFHLAHGIATLAQNEIMIGGLFVAVAFVAVGRPVKS